MHFYLVVSGQCAIIDLRNAVPSSAVLQHDWRPHRVVALIDVGENAEEAAEAAHALNRLHLGVTAFADHDAAVGWVNETFGYLTDETFRFLTLKEICHA